MSPTKRTYRYFSILPLCGIVIHTIDRILQLFNVIKLSNGNIGKLPKSEFVGLINIGLMPRKRRKY